MTWVWIALAVLLVAAGALTPVLTGRRRRALRSNDEAVAARSRYHQLGHYVEDTVVTPDQVDDEQAAVLLRTARERWLTTGAALARASTEADFAHAEEIAVQGLTAVADAYARLGRPAPRVPKKP
jgi:type II secretory pathway pseudopilin PulG